MSKHNDSIAAGGEQTPLTERQQALHSQGRAEQWIRRHVFTFGTLASGILTTLGCGGAPPSASSATSAPSPAASAGTLGAPSLTPAQDDASEFLQKEKTEHLDPIHTPPDAMTHATTHLVILSDAVHKLENRQVILENNLTNLAKNLDALNTASTPGSSPARVANPREPGTQFSRVEDALHFLYKDLATLHSDRADAHALYVEWRASLGSPFETACKEKYEKRKEKIEQNAGEMLVRYDFTKAPLKNFSNDVQKFMGEKHDYLMPFPLNQKDMRIVHTEASALLNAALLLQDKIKIAENDILAMAKNLNTAGVQDGGDLPKQLSLLKKMWTDLNTIYDFDKRVSDAYKISMAGQKNPAAPEHTRQYLRLQQDAQQVGEAIEARWNKK